MHFLLRSADFTMYVACDQVVFSSDAFRTSFLQFFTLENVRHGRDMPLRLSDNIRMRDDMTFQRSNLGSLDLRKDGYSSHILVGSALVYLKFRRLRTIHILL